jgi:uncharacterized repeat protein (TIGR01451 family)
MERSEDRNMIAMKKSLPASMTSRLPRSALAGAALLLGLCYSTGALAQAQRSFINLGFEQPNLTTNGCRVYINSAQVPGWQTTHPDTGTENSGGCVLAGGLGTSPGPILELWRTPRNNSSGGTVNAPEGVQIAELNAAAASRIYQNVCLVNGERVNWRFSHRGRGSDTVRDVAEMKVRATGTVIRVGTTNSGAFDTPVVSQGTANAPVNIAGNTSWVRYTGGFSYAGATGVSNIGFEAISAQGGATNGNLLDDIQIEMAPFVEFTQPSSSATETAGAAGGAGANLPTLRVNGTVLTAFTVTVNITGGTASRPADYTTPGNLATVTVNVPAGNYDGTSATGSLFALPITVVNDTASEPNETIQFQIAPASGAAPAYQLFSSTTCGGAAQTTWEYTIIDDDGGLSISKNASMPVAVGGSLTQYDITYTIAVTNPSGSSVQYSSLVDNPAFDPDVTINGLTGLSRTTTPNTGGTSGGALTAVPLNTSGPWSLITGTRTLGGNRTDTYTLVVRFTINPGATGLDDCSASGRGLYNSTTATRVAAGNPTHTASACQTTPTPTWVTLRKQLQGRAAATDQFQVRLFSGGIQSASATTSGSAAPSTASTGQQVLPAGTILQFEEALKANGTGADQAPANYATLLTCTNASSGSTTVLPGGSGTTLGNRQQWPEFTPAPGDVLDCAVTNTPGGANLSITKTNTPGVNGNIDQAGDVVIKGADTTYTLVVRNNGPVAANGAVVRDTPAAGLSCGTATCTAAGASQCPAATGAALASALQTGTGVAIPLLPAGAANTVTFTLTCQVQ